jgi:hypothetical protein
MFWWILLGILVLLLILPLGASIFYDAAGVRVLVVAGPIRFTVFPMKKKPPREKAPKEQPAAENAEENPSEEPVPAEPVEPTPVEEPTALPAGEVKKTPTPLPEAPKPPKEKEPDGGSLLDFLPLVELVLKFVGEFFHRTLHIDVLYLKMTMAGGDPADLAINYGNTWAALGNLWPYIDRMFTIKKRDIQIQCDFESSESLVNARVDITITLARLLGLVFGYAFRILIKFLRIMWDRKKKAEAAKKLNNPKNNKAV